MKYKYTRKEIADKWETTIKYSGNDLIRDLLAQKEDKKDFYGESIGMKEQEKINRVRNTIRNNELNTLVGKLKCNGKKHFFDKGNICNCGGISFINPTPSLLEIEEIEEIHKDKNITVNFATKRDLALAIMKTQLKTNSLIRNQKKLYQYIKSLKIK